MIKCSSCGKEIDEKAVKLTIRGKKYHFCDEFCLRRFHLIRRETYRVFSSVVLNKTFAEIIAIITGLGGIAYTLIDVANRALLMDTFSAIAAIASFIAGVEHLRYLKEHNLRGRAVLFIGIGIMISLATIVSIDRSIPILNYKVSCLANHCLVQWADELYIPN